MIEHLGDLSAVVARIEGPAQEVTLAKSWLFWINYLAFRRFAFFFILGDHCDRDPVAPDDKVRIGAMPVLQPLVENAIRRTGFRGVRRRKLVRFTPQE